ncbi:MAG: hypothetical protein KGJ43_08145, partial [Acidobacteriota bacterium]|nr:hypothetical protein [Acidobacteriota bacterium]
ELSWDAVHGIPLRAALYSTTSSAPVVELAATEISYEPVEASVFELGTPPGAKIVEPGAARGATGGATAGSGPSGPAKGRHGGERPKVTTIGHGIGSILVLESRGATGTAGKPASSPLQGTQKVDINGVLANELPTALGTILTFERDGISYVVAGSRPASAIEAAARGL